MNEEDEGLWMVNMMMECNVPIATAIAEIVRKSS